MKTFRSYRIASEFYRAVKGLRLPDYLKDQLGRAASSIVLNLAEGSGRRTPKDKRRFYQMAFGSLRECQAVLDLMPEKDTELVLTADKLGAHIYKLIQSLDC
mgnify:CR=1 FL=1